MMKFTLFFTMILIGANVSFAQSILEMDDAVSADSLSARKAIDRKQLRVDIMNYCKSNSDEAIQDFFKVYKEEHPETGNNFDGAFDKINFSVEQFDEAFIKHHLKFPVASVIVFISRSEKEYRVDNDLGRLFYVQLSFRLSNTGSVLGHQECLVFFNQNKSKDKSKTFFLDKKSKKRSCYYRK